MSAESLTLALDAETRHRLLRLARQTLETHYTGRSAPADDRPWPPLPRCGAFVTLRRAARLRGCIGTFETDEELSSLVRRLTLSAARDPRFTDNPVSGTEIGDLRIEISLLSPLTRLSDPLDFEPGRHGIYVRRGDAVGCFLPDVATERNWNRETFLGECCRQKAHLDPLAWKDPATEVCRFEVEKISEPS